ncbi:MAG: HAD family phosphatase [Acidobacteriota bacterium]
MNASDRFHLEALVLDAMGVLYAEADDGPNLLYPFIVENGGNRDVTEIIRLYSLASLGKISSYEFWRAAGVDPKLEDEYLERHKLSDGLTEFLKRMRSQGTDLWCLSNDVSEWSRKLRNRFGLPQYFREFIISGDIGLRKPDPAVYRHMLDRAGAEPSEVVFIDDRLKNIAAAHVLGIRGILFKPSAKDRTGHQHPIAENFADLLTILENCFDKV